MPTKKISFNYITIVLDARTNVLFAREETDSRITRLHNQLNITKQKEYWQRLFLKRPVD